VNLTDLTKQINRDIDDSYSNGDIKEWINRGIDDITPVAKKEARTTLTYPYVLPADLHKIAFIKVNGVKVEYDQWGDEITPKEGNQNPIDLYYYKRLTKLQNADDVPDFEEEYHDLLILYALGQIQYHDEDYDDRPDALNRYAQRKLEFQQYRERKRSRGRVMEKVVW
jgi:hypothetical protein